MKKDNRGEQRRTEDNILKLDTKYNRIGKDAQSKSVIALIIYYNYH